MESCDSTVQRSPCRGHVVERAGPAAVAPVFAARTTVECGKGIGFSKSKNYNDEIET